MLMSCFATDLIHKLPCRKHAELSTGSFEKDSLFTGVPANGMLRKLLRHIMSVKNTLSSIQSSNSHNTTSSTEKKWRLDFKGFSNKINLEQPFGRLWREVSQQANIMREFQRDQGCKRIQICYTSSINAFQKESKQRLLNL